MWYLEPSEPGTILAALAAGPGHVAEAVVGHDDEALDLAPAAGSGPRARRSGTSCSRNRSCPVA